MTIAIKKMGYDVYALKAFKAYRFILSHPRMVFARMSRRIAQKTGRKFFIPVPYQISPERKIRMDQYTRDNFQELTISSDNEWNRIIDEKMAFVAGSDIIWQPAFGYPERFFLDFAVYADLPCFSYASSVGSLSVPKKYYGAYRKYLDSFKAIGVRENATVEMFSRIIKHPLTKVVDPTLLLSKDDWDAFADKAKYSVTINERYIFCYFVMNDQRYWDYAKMVQNMTGLQIVVLPMHYLDEKQPFTIIKDGTPYEFVDLIRRAEFVLTDSFHTCAFSLQFKKEFYLLRRERKAEDAKFDEFLNRYGLQERTIMDRSSFERKTEINYELAYNHLKQDRERSMTFLKQTLQKCE
ncbi:MAG: polysaccharide pyruvyl transferase family protein [Oscillospiraceae bacterium]|nr:polysaccharide pyruvyl transferase family protein [Oscillospiraceae bacterium]